MFLVRTVISAVIALIFLTRIDALFKITKVDCRSNDETNFKFDYCRLKAVRRDVAEFSLKLIVKKPIVNVWLNAEVLRKYNTYKPTIFNHSAEVCSFLKNRGKVPALKVIFDLFTEFSNINHTCPYESDVILEKLYLKHSKLTLPVPSAEYLLKTAWRINKGANVNVDVWFIFEEVEFWKRPAYAKNRSMIMQRLDEAK